MIDIEKIRQDTPNCQNKLFFNSAGSSLPPQIVLDKVFDYLRIESEIGGYKLAEIRNDEIQEFYTQTANLIGCDSRNIAFMQSATEAYLKALSAIDFKENDLIITTDNDYVSNQLQFLSLKQRFHIRIERVKNLENGDLDISDFQRLIAIQKPKLVAITHIPTNSGLVQDVETIGEICEANNFLYLVDTCQSVGQILVDVKKLKCDFLTATGRKFLRAPRGTGFLYASDKVLDSGYAPLFLDNNGAIWTSGESYQLAETAKRFQTWELNYALLIGLKEAVKYANDIGMQKIEDYNSQVVKQLRQNLASIKGIKMYDQGSKICNIVTFRKEGKNAEEIKQKLEAHQVFFGISPKHAGLLDFQKKGIDWIVRLAPHYFNTLEEVNRVSEIIDEM